MNGGSSSLGQQSGSNHTADRLKSLFFARQDGELTQVEFWNLYKDTFTPFESQQPALPAAEVIKNVTVVFPKAQAMVIGAGTPQSRFVIRGIDRRKVDIIMSRFQCQWGDPPCGNEGNTEPQSLYDHLLEHGAQQSSHKCLWANCTVESHDAAALRLHLLTHVPPPNAPEYIKPGTSSLAWDQPPPPLKDQKLISQRASAPPTSTALTALLIVRLVYRMTAVTTDSVLRADEDHIGFPGILEEIEEEQNASIDAAILQGEKRGRRSIWMARHLMESVCIADKTLMGWITEMLDAGAPS
jgi:chromatin structure-remodeling complex subunit RSC9